MWDKSCLLSLFDFIKRLNGSLLSFKSCELKILKEKLISTGFKDELDLLFPKKMLFLFSLNIKLL